MSYLSANPRWISAISVDIQVVASVVSQRQEAVATTTCSNNRKTGASSFECSCLNSHVAPGVGSGLRAVALASCSQVGVHHIKATFSLPLLVPLPLPMSVSVSMPVPGTPHAVRVVRNSSTGTCTWAHSPLHSSITGTMTMAITMPMFVFMTITTGLLLLMLRVRVDVLEGRAMRCSGPRTSKIGQLNTLKIRPCPRVGAHRGRWWPGDHRAHRCRWRPGSHGRDGRVGWRRCTRYWCRGVCHRLPEA